MKGSSFIKIGLYRIKNDLKVVLHPTRKGEAEAAKYGFPVAGQIRNVTHTIEYCFKSSKSGRKQDGLFFEALL